MGQEISNSKYFEILFFLITVEMYPQDVKNIAISVYKKSKSLREAEYLTSISKSSISRWNSCLTIQQTKKSKYNEDKKPIIIDVINAISKLNHSFTVLDVQQYLKFHNGIRCSYELIRCVMKSDLKLSYKKTKYKQYLNENLLQAKTNEYKSNFRNSYNENSSVFYVDEVGFSTKSNQ